MTVQFFNLKIAFFVTYIESLGTNQFLNTELVSDLATNLSNTSFLPSTIVIKLVFPNIGFMLLLLLEQFHLFLAFL